MRQLALDLIAQAEPTLDNFVVGPNAELCAVLHAAATGPHQPPRVHIWGESTCGKTHLLRALSSKPLGPDNSVEEFQQALGEPGSAREQPAEGRPTVIAVDDCERLSDAQQLALFGLFNRAAAVPGVHLVTASRQAPLALTNLRPELRTRLGSGLVLALRPLSDDDRERALREAARASGVNCADDVYRYLLTRKARDLRSLLTYFARLDRYALERKRPLTTALAREYEATLAEESNFAPRAGEAP
jgi:DnaA family protein